MKRKFFLFLALVGLAAVLASSCNTTSEEHRSVVSVSSINDNAPFFSDVLDQGDSIKVTQTGDDFIQEDYVPVTFYNRPYSSAVTTDPELPYSDFIITRYTVTWERVDGGPALPASMSFTGGTSIIVPTTETVEASILLVPALLKQNATISALQYSANEILAIAHIQFYGHEVGSDREWAVPASLSVSFGDYLGKKK
jgi:hypothetical protein